MTDVRHNVLLPISLVDTTAIAGMKPCVRDCVYTAVMNVCNQNNVTVDCTSGETVAHASWVRRQEIFLRACAKVADVDNANIRDACAAAYAKTIIDNYKSQTPDSFGDDIPNLQRGVLRKFARRRTANNNDASAATSSGIFGEMITNLEKKCAHLEHWCQSWSASPWGLQSDIDP